MSALEPVILNEVKLTQKAVADLAGTGSSGPTEYPWEVFTSSRSWTVPDDGEYFILCLGGGGGGTSGGGGGGTSGGYGGGGGGGFGGGGGGGVSIAYRQLSKSTALTLTVGSGGIGSSGG